MARRKMDQKIKTKWIKALRSKKYKQGSGRLRDNTHNVDKHCCLGVLCSISGKGRWSPTFNKNVFKYNYKGNTGVGSVPDQLLDELNITPRTQSTLIKMNDDQNKNFTQIADWIEANL